VVPSATSPVLRAAGPWTFTQVPSNAAQADFIIDFMSTELEARTLTIFYSSNEYGSGLKNALTRALEGTRTHILDPIESIELVADRIIESSEQERALPRQLSERMSS
jgi:ABC-type branched-subunit amino acid transport system substrate-binding protein